MRVVAFIDVFEKIRIKWKLAAGVLVLFAIAGVLFGIRTDRGIVAENTKSTEYEDALATYDSAVTDVENSIVTCEEQIKDLEDYFATSVYMNLDANNIYCGSIQYRAVANEGVDVGAVLNAYLLFVNDGSFKEKICEGIEGMEPTYLKESVSAYLASNMITITIMHYDENVLKTIMESAKAVMEAQIPTVAGVQGGHTLPLLDESIYTKADRGILNDQNNNRNNLKGYQTNLADLKNKLVDETSKKENYIKNHEPEVPQESNIIKNIIKYLLIFALIGIVIVISVVLLIIMYSPKLETITDITSSIKENGYRINADNVTYVAASLYGIMKEKGWDEVAVISSIQDYTQAEPVVNFVNTISKYGIKAVPMKNITKDAEEIIKLQSIGKCVYAEKIGRSDFSKVMGLVNMCRENGIETVGVVVENEA